MSISTGQALEHKGYLGTVEAEVGEGILFGTVQGIEDVVHYEGRTLAELAQAFRESVDAYLVFCQEQGREPEKPFSGRFVVRMSPALHRQAASVAAVRNMSLNDVVVEALRKHCGEALSGGGAAGPSAKSA